MNSDPPIPDDLPEILEYRCGAVSIVALPRRPVSFISSNGQTDAPQVTPKIPLGASGWRRVTEIHWHPLQALPDAWLPFLNRRRPSRMDARMPLIIG